MRASAGAWEFR